MTRIKLWFTISHNLIRIEIIWNDLYIGIATRESKKLLILEVSDLKREQKSNLLPRLSIKSGVEIF